jgi:hypothetical protein
MKKTRVYAAIKFIDAQGLGVDQGLTVSGLGAVTINEFLGSGAAVSRVISALNNNIDGLLPGIQTRVNNLDTFGLEFDSATQTVEHTRQFSATGCSHSVGGV